MYLSVIYLSGEVYMRTRTKDSRDLNPYVNLLYVCRYTHMMSHKYRIQAYIHNVRMNVSICIRIQCINGTCKYQTSYHH